MGRLIRFGFTGVVVLAGAALLTGPAEAATVYDFSTGKQVSGGRDLNWSVTEVPGTFGGDAPAFDAYTLEGHPAWIDDSSVGDGSAQWIGPSEDADAAMIENGKYVYSTFVDLQPGAWALAGQYSSDNVVTNVELVADGATLLSTSPPDNTRQFEQSVLISDAMVSSGPQRLSFTVRNDTANPSPTGLIAQGEVVAVPTPSSAASLGATLALMGAVTFVRRRHAA